MNISEMIEKIVQFFVHSPILAVILIGIVGKIISNAKSGKNRMPSFGGDKPFGNPDAPSQTSEAERRDEPSRHIYEEVETHTPAPMAHPSVSPFSAPVAVQVEPARPNQMVRTERAPMQYVSEPSYALHKADAIEPSVSREELVKGLVWAEILGPPRAKRPYGRR
ncbi:hypothetical protein [Paenibacillus terrigena]|uniref:hypothetical protein n=1 Tax=Paenibacillus terrigena TaxID=369333 RepID=UPI0003618BC6|nr:hypothetical protein [Paenibacillus terrigena]